MAIELLDSTSSRYDVFFVGGKLSRGSQLATGGSSINILSEITADICFLGTGYLDVDKGITETDWEIAQMKKAMIYASKRVVALTISKKLNTFNRYKIYNIKGLDTLVTELDPDNVILDKYSAQNIDIL
jgi:DeoR/GlpR family transcriptional regulator of sugar metabolism